MKSVASLLLFFLVIPTWTSTQKQKTPKEIAAAFSASVVLVVRELKEGAIGLGTGFFVSAKIASLKNRVQSLEEAPPSSQPQPTIEPPPQKVRKLIFEGDFETGDLSQYVDWKKEFTLPYSHQIVESPVRNRRYASRFELRKSDPGPLSGGRHRTELGGYHLNSKFLEDIWYGFSVLLPNDWEIDPARDEFFQVHGTPDLGLGEIPRTPVLYFITQGDLVKIWNRWDARRVTPGNEAEGSEVVWQGSLDRGNWVDWVIHARWSPWSEGLLEIWRNGVQVVKKTGPNVYNDSIGPFPKFGIYKWDWVENPNWSTVDRRVLYIDEFRMGGPDSSFEDVVP